MRTCKFCHSESPDDSNFCGQCGQRIYAPGETSTGDNITLATLWPVRNDTGVDVGENTPFTTSNSAINKETDSRHDTPITGVDEDWDHEILHTYDDVDDEHAATVVHENAEVEEEGDEEERKLAPFLPTMPGSDSIQPAGSAPLAQDPLYIDQVPSANPPRIPGQPASGIVQSSESPPPQFPQPVQPAPAPQVQLAPLHNTIPRQELIHPQPRHHLLFLRHHHLRPPCLVVVVVSSILASIIIAIMIAFFPQTHPSSSPFAELIGAPILGKTMVLHGGNFVPGEIVTYTIDVRLGASPQGNALAGPSHGMNTNALLFAPHPVQSPTLQHKTVGSDGAFNATIFIDPSWPASSTHTVYVYNQDSKLIRSLPFTVVVLIAQTGLVGCVSGADPIILGPISEGSNQRGSKTITLCTTGSGLVDWTARWDQQWLQLDHSGQITAPQHGQVTFSASANGLKPGSYTTPVIFSSQQSSVKVLLSVTLVILKKASSVNTSLPGTACVSATPQSLSFANTAMQSNTLLQRVTLNNCGNAVTWSASVSTNDGKQWLGINSSRGTLQSGGLQDIIIAASSANLPPGTFTGHVNFNMGSSNGEVQVTFKVRPPPQAPPCINVNSQPLIFMGFAGQSDPSSQQVTLANCGAAGHWAASIVTDDGVNWLNINPAGGDLKEGGTQQVSVIVSSTPLLANKGTYRGTITFAMGSSIVTVNVTFIVKPQCIRAGPQSLLFESTAGQGDPSPQSVTIANCGAGGKWFGSVSTNDGANWLNINQSSSNLNVGIAQGIAVNVSGAQLSPGIYTGQVLFAVGSSTAAVRVTFIVKQPKQCISVNTDALNFTSIQDQGDPEPQTVTIGPCGGTGIWSSSISTDNGAPWISTGSSGGELKGGTFQDISIRLSTVGLSVGKHVGYITFSIGSSSKNVKITLLVQPRLSTACISPAQRSLTFTSIAVVNSATSGTNSIQESRPGSQTEGITNCGDTGSWSVPVPSVTDDGVNWLGVKSVRGDLQAGESTGVAVTVDSNSLKAGTYTATIPFIITTKAGATATARVGVTLTVSSSSSSVCKANPPSLTFTSVWGKDLPAALDVALTNCGANDSWTESDDSGTSLNIFPYKGNLDSKGGQVISVRIDDPTTIPPKSYKYSLTFTTGAGNLVVVPVTWNLLPSTNQACIQADTSSLSFSATQGESTGAGLNFIICGTYGGKVSVVPSTTDGANWLTVKYLNGSGPYPVGYGPHSLISLNSTNLTSGKTYSGSIKATIITPQGSQASVTVGVALNMQASSTPKPIVPAQSDTTTVVPTQTEKVMLYCRSSCIVETSTIVPTGTSMPSPTGTSISVVTPIGANLKRKGGKKGKKEGWQAVLWYRQKNSRKRTRRTTCHLPPMIR